MTDLRSQNLRTRTEATHRRVKRPGPPRALLALVLGACLVTTGGCFSNHAFVRGADLDVPALATELASRDKDKGKKGDALVDVVYIPFAHMDLQVFAENEDVAHYPAGHAFVSVRSWLPLFGIVDGSVELYDAEQRVYERGDFTSILWGLWTRERTTIPTAHGERTERNGRFLWLLDWGRHVRYESIEEQSASRGEVGGVDSMP
jgi:hypothetical protein